MSEHSNISWTSATWNPVVGCQKVSAGCDNCYAIRDGWRMGHNPNEKVNRAYSGLVYSLNGRLNWTGAVRTLEDRLEIPLHWKKPRRIFVNSQSDLFHKDVPEDFIRAVFSVMARAHWHTFQVLTKRPQRMAAILQEWMLDGLTLREGYGADLPNVWLGTSVEDQKTANERIPSLIQTPAAVRFVSYEPALGPVDFTNFEIMGHSMDALRGEWCSEDTSCMVSDKSDNAIGWVIVGGESGPGARVFDIGWARSIVRQCRAAGVPVFVKQLGSRPMEFAPNCYRLVSLEDKNGGDPSEWPADLQVQQFPA
jgi:protein gp37